MQTDIRNEYPFIISRIDMVEAAGIELLISTDNIQVIDSKRRQKR